MSSSRTLWKVVAARRSGRTPTVIAMTLVFAIAMMALLSAVAANSGIDRRGDRVAWRTPVAVTEGQTASLRMSTVTTAAAGRPLVETTIAVLTDGAPTPPGLDRLLEPGQFAVSSALADLAEQNAAFARFRGASAVIDRSGVLHDDELAVVRFVQPDDPRLAAANPSRFVTSSGPADVARFSTHHSSGSSSELYRTLVALGTVVLVLPALTMTATAARLVAGRQARELAVARLIGARRNQIGAIAVWDVVGSAVAGVALGSVAMLALLPLAASIDVQGGAFRSSELFPSIGWWSLCGIVVVGVATLATMSSVRRATAHPLSVVTNSRPRRAGWWRLAFLVAAIALFMQTTNSPGAGTTALIAAWSAAIVALDTVGPLVMRMLAAVRVRTARTAVGLVAARRMADDPVAAYRQVGSLALAAFVAGMLLATSSSLHSTPTSESTLRVVVPEASIDQARLALERVPGVERVEVTGDEWGGPPELNAELATPSVADDARAALADASPAAIAMTDREQGAMDDLAVEDFGRAALLLFFAVLAAAMVTIAASSVGSLVDQQRALTTLRTMGIPIESLRAARRRAVVAPVALSGSLAALAGAWLGSRAAQSAPSASGIALLTVVVGAGIIGTVAAQESTTPLMRSLTGDRRVLVG